MTVDKLFVAVSTCKTLPRFVLLQILISYEFNIAFENVFSYFTIICKENER